MRSLIIRIECWIKQTKCSSISFGRKPDRPRPLLRLARESTLPRRHSRRCGPLRSPLHLMRTARQSLKSDPGQDSSLSFPNQIAFGAGRRTRDPGSRFDRSLPGTAPQARARARTLSRDHAGGIRAGPVVDSHPLRLPRPMLFHPTQKPESAANPDRRVRDNGLSRFRHLRAVPIAENLQVIQPVDHQPWTETRLFAK
jgi:hypothetical protein